MLYRKFRSIKIDGAIGVSPVGDDTLLIAKIASKVRCQSVLDVGMGTGFIPIYLSTLGRNCVGIDINEYAIFCAKKNAIANNTDCQFIVSDLFSRVKGKYDLITFNPPFGNTSRNNATKLLEIVKSLIPKDNDLFIKLSYLMIRGSRQKLIKRFLTSARKNLKKNGQVLILLYPPEMRLVKNYQHKKVGKYKDFSLVALRI